MSQNEQQQFNLESENVKNFITRDNIEIEEINEFLKQQQYSNKNYLIIIVFAINQLRQQLINANQAQTELLNIISNLNFQNSDDTECYSTDELSQSSSDTIDYRQEFLAEFQDQIVILENSSSQNSNVDSDSSQSVTRSSYVVSGNSNFIENQEQIKYENLKQTLVEGLQLMKKIENQMMRDKIAYQDYQEAITQIPDSYINSGENSFFVPYEIQKKDVYVVDQKVNDSFYEKLIETNDSLSKIINFPIDRAGTFSNTADFQDILPDKKIQTEPQLMVKRFETIAFDKNHRFWTCYNQEFKYFQNLSDNILKIITNQNLEYDNRQRQWNKFSQIFKNFINKKMKQYLNNLNQD